MLRSLLPAAALLATAATVSAGVIRVPEDYPSVLAGVDAAVAGDSVLVSPGTWTEADTRTVIVFGFPQTVTACAFLKGGVTLAGTGMPDQTVLDLSAGGPGFQNVVIVANETEPVTIANLTLTGVVGPGSAVAILDSDLVSLVSCRIPSNGDGVTAGEALVSREAKIVLRDCEISQNYSPSSVVSATEVNLTVQECRFEANVGQVLFCNDSDVLVEDSWFVSNTTDMGCPALSFGATSFIVRGNFFLGNTSTEPAPGGPGAMSIGQSSGIVEFNVFAFDSSYAGGGGALSWGGSRGGGENAIRSNTFYACHGVHGGALNVGDLSLSFANNVVAESTGSPAVNLVFGTITGDSGCNDYWNNVEGNFSGIPNDWPERPGDFFEDPLFCDPVVLDWTLRSDSPCAGKNAPNCGQVGVLGVGCGTVSVSPQSWGRIKGGFR